MRLLSAIAAMLLLLAILPIKALLVRIGVLPELLAVFVDAVLVVTLLTFAILGNDATRKEKP